ncbi:MAG: FAD:protein FMN transferase [Proteobacteria bacterium]|nr:FAD:protein FMN transferase [Pseudomonadota bacterium]
MSLCRCLPVLSALLSVACGDGRLPELALEGNVMGTTFSISIVEPPETLDEEVLQADVVAALTRIDELASTWRDDSELSAFNNDRAIDWIIVSAEFCEMLSAALELGRETGGAFDVTVGPLVNLWGFGPGGMATGPPDDDAIADAMRSVGFGKIEADCAEKLVRKDDAAMYVDLSGWAKGYAVDEVAALLDSLDVSNYLVEIGGEIRVRGHNSEKVKWKLAIEAPSTSERVPHAVINVTDTAVATSGDYRNYFEHGGTNYSHTIDPRTGRPVSHGMAAVTVVHPSAAYADAIATAILVLGPEDGSSLAYKLNVAAYMLVREGGRLHEIRSPAFEHTGIR